MATDYPDAVDSLPRPTAATAMNASGFEGDVVIDNISDAIEAVQTELGTNPAGSYASVAAFLADLLARLSALETPPVPGQPTYGNGWSMDSLGNMQVGGPASGASNTWVSMRFVAQETGTITKVKPFLVPAVSPYTPGYAGGTGGEIRISLEEDDGTGMPVGWYESGGSRSGTGSTLAYVDASGTDFDHADDRWNEYTFGSPGSVTSGQAYHIVFSNIDAAPVTNYISVDLRIVQSAGLEDPMSPADPYREYKCCRKIGSGAWADQSRYGHIMALTYGSTNQQGKCYMEVELTNLAMMSDTSWVRERFTPTSDQSVTGAYVRMRRVSGDGDLTFRLENSSGTEIESFTVTTGAIATDANKWIGGAFANPHTLTGASEYRLRLSCDSSTVCRTVGIQQGSSVGYPAALDFNDGVLEVSTDSGSTWAYVTGLAADGDMQFYFTTT